MDPIAFTLLCALSIVTLGNTYELRQVDGITGDVNIIRFDSENNAYVVSSGPAGYPFLSKFYKLTNKTLVWATHWDGSTRNVWINDQDDIYATHILLPDWATVNVLRRGSKTFEELDRVAYPIYDFMDNDGNLFYSVGSGGMKMIRVNESTPVNISGTENFQVYQNSPQVVSRYLVAADKDGDVYFGGCYNGGSKCDTDTTEFQLIVITAEEKQKEFPTAEIVGIVIMDGKNEYVSQILASRRKELLISTYNLETANGTVQKFNNGNVSLLSLKEGFHFGKEAGDRIIYETVKLDPQVMLACDISYLNLKDEFVPIENLQGLKGHFTCPVDIADPDGEGDLYLASGKDLDTSPVEFLNHAESKSVGVDFNVELRAASTVLAVGDGNLWLIGNDHEVFYVEKKSLSGVKLFKGEYISGFKINKNNGELYVLGIFGLYVIVNN